MLPSAAAKTKHCDLEAGWLVAMKFKLSKNVTLTYWGANLSKELTAYCYLAQRKSVAKGSYMTLAIDGVGRYTSGKSITRLVRLSDRCIQAAVMLFKKKDGNPHTYWKGELSSRQCG